ncbi:hypothetical protein SO802_028084 [Lithocarpus litseifolius]|uniref:RNase H type-1 domain-containing protein n=1 Tax=Lithocarpus litseifolius TaxID=425828 RepID=A0AAW2BPF6_9ROSI
MQRDYGIVIPYSKIFADAKDSLYEYQAAQKANKPELAILDPSRWSPPPVHLLIENFDRALFHETSCAGIGVVIRNATGKVVGALSERINLPPTVEDVEALACRGATVLRLNWACTMWFSKDSATVINHLQEDTPCLASFDDTSLFCKATPGECHRLLDILAKYEAASSQAINHQKTSFFFSHNTRHAVKKEIRGLMGAQIMTGCEKYLGLPMVGGRSKVSTFKELQEKVTKRVTGWKEKHISKAGREVLIKTVA